MQEKEAIDRVRSRKFTANALGISTKTLQRLEKAGKLKDLPRVYISERIIGHRDSDINAVIARRTAAVIP